MAERTETDCQKITDRWLSVFQSADQFAKNFFENTSSDNLVDVANLFSRDFVSNLYSSASTLNADYAAVGLGLLSSLYTELKKKGP